MPDLCCENSFPEFLDDDPVRIEDGEVISLKGSQIRGWNEKNQDFQASESDWMLNFILEDGHVSVLDPAAGKSSQLFQTPRPAVLAELLKLFFDEGRKELARRSDGEPALTGICVPFFQFPDDFTEDHGEFPLVPLAQARELIRVHVADDTPWLRAMEDLQPEIRDLSKKVEAQREDFLPPSDLDEESELERGEKAGQELSLALSIAEQEKREKQKPALFHAAREINPRHFCRTRQELHSNDWRISYEAFGASSQCPYLPVSLVYNDHVFAPGIDQQYDPATHTFVFGNLISYVQGSSDVRLPLSLDLPPYAEQVETFFRQTVLMHQIPILTRKAMRLKAGEKQTARACLKKRQAFHTSLIGLSLNPDASS